MKEYRQEPGGRRVKGDDLIAIQDTALISEQLLGSYGDFVIAGCQKVGAGLSSGIVMLGGKACVFDGLPEVTLPIYIKKLVETKTVGYEVGEGLGHEIFKAVAATSEEEGKFQLDEASPRFADKFKPKNAINADTVDGKHANEFLQLSNFHGNIDWIHVTGSYRIHAEASGTFPSNVAKLGSNLLHLNWNGDAAQQIYFDLLKNNVFYRRKVDSVWSAWSDMADGGNADTVDGKHANAFLERNGGSMTEGSSVGVVPITAGGNAVGLYCRNTQGNSLGGVGGLFTDGILQLMYVGWGDQPWNSGDNFHVSPTAIRYKNNKVWHAGNMGTGSELDADTVDGKHADDFLQLANFYGNIDTINVTGSYRLHADVSGMFPGNAAKLGSNLLHLNWDNNAAQQVYFDLISNTVFYRRKVGGAWLAWTNIADGGNADTVDGKHAADFVPKIAVYDTSQDPNLATVPVLLTSHTNCPTKGLYYIYTFFYENTNSSKFQIAYKYFDGVSAFMRNKYLSGGEWTAWRRMAMAEPNGDIIANSLATARTIWGQGFNGTGNIRGTLWGVDGIDAFGTIRTSGVFSTGEYVDDAYGFYNVTRLPNLDNATCYAMVRSGVAAFGIGYNLSNQIVMGHGSKDKTIVPWLAVGGGNSSFSGSVTASGFYQSSDERLKDIKADFNPSLEDILELPLFYYSLKDKPDKQQIGTSAQKVMDKFPELVTQNTEGYYSVAYDKLAVLALKGMSLVNEELSFANDSISQLNDKLSKLEERLTKIENYNE